jgi:murein DD-endopeptidase MepM/ murein hydrolase activator NlpD
MEPNLPKDTSMKTKLVWGLVIVVGLVAVCLVGAAFTGAVSAVAACQAANPSPTAAAEGQPPPDTYLPITTGQVTWGSDQVHNAATIITVGDQLAVPPRGWVIAVATAIQESNLHNLPGGDRDSIGLFQQRPSQGWGTPAQLQDPVYAATKFYTRLLTINNWQTMPLTQAAQAVQRSAYPDAYAKWETYALTIVMRLSGVTDLTATSCAYTVSTSGWTQPVHGKIGSGFRTPDRPTHDGVDLIVAKGTPIHAAADGTVVTVRCNAVDARTGADWGCDRDGDPQLTAGCGWYVDIEHANHISTRYCHQLIHPYVTEGQRHPRRSHRHLRQHRTQLRTPPTLRGTPRRPHHSNSNRSGILHGRTRSSAGPVETHSESPTPPHRPAAARQPHTTDASRVNWQDW